ncbi:MAG: ROK family protein [Akkermansia sp.]
MIALMMFDEPCAIAVDFGGTSIKMGVTCGERILKEAERIPTPNFSSPEAMIAEMIKTARALKSEFPSACVIGLGLPGWCDYQKRVVYQLTNVDVWNEVVPIREMMEEALQLPVILDNDGNCMAYAEWKMGAGKNLQSIVCMTMGTGLGGGMIINDRMVRGKRVSAAELGMTSIDYRGRKGPFGNKGAIEEYIGNNELAADAVARYAEAGIVKNVSECNPRALEDAARAGCPIAGLIWDDCAAKLACLMMNLMYTFVPEAFIIGGGVAKAGELLFEPLRRHLDEQLFFLHQEELLILPAYFGSESGLIGAGAMALDEVQGKGELKYFKKS